MNMVSDKKESETSRVDLGTQLVQLSEPPRLPSKVCYAIACFALLILCLDVLLIREGLVKKDSEVWGGIILLSTVSGVGFVLAVIGFAYRVRHRHDRTEVFQNGFCRVRRDVDSCHLWGEVLYCTTFDAVHLGQKISCLQVGLKNGSDFVLSAVQLELVSRIFLAKTKEARSTDFANEFEAGRVVQCGGLGISQEGIAVKRKKLGWRDVAEIDKLLVVVNVNGQKGSGHPVLRIFCHGQPKRPYLIVDMCKVHNSDIVLP
jgi:hypothetical protein